MPTMRAVAQKASVGVGTVSRALNDTGYASKETCKKILAAADEIGYKYELPHTSMKTTTIGIMLPMLQHPFFSKMAGALETELIQRGYECLIYDGNNIHQGRALDMLDEGILNGLIALGSPPHGFSGRNKKAIVSMDRWWGEDVPLVHSDHIQGGRLAAEAFLESGCHVTSILAPWNSMCFSYDRNVVRDYWNVIREMDGCMTNDVAAMNCLSLALEMGTKVPEQLRIIGYDGTEITRLSYPALSVVEQDCPALAIACADRLLELMEGKSTEMETMVPVIWRKRGTT